MPFLPAVGDLSRSVIEILGNTLLPGIALVLLVEAFLRVFHKVNASTRHGVWLFGMVILLFMPLLSTLSHVQIPTPGAATSDQPSSLDNTSTEPTAMNPSMQPQTTANVSIPESSGETMKSSPQDLSEREPLQSNSSNSRGAVVQLPSNLAIYLFLAWLVGGVALLARLVWGYLHLQWLKHKSTACTSELIRLSEHLFSKRASRNAEIRFSSEIGTPMFAGLFHPMILIPSSLIQHLSQSELEQVILHELAHRRRKDDWTKFLQRVIQAIFCFHPAVWWISKKLDFEREVACDDWVLNQVEFDWRMYTSCLLNVMKSVKSQKRRAFTTGLLMARTQIERRIQMLLDQRRVRTIAISKPRIALIALVTFITVILISQIAPQIAVSQQTNPILTKIEQANQAVLKVKTNSSLNSYGDATRTLIEPLELEMRFPIADVTHFSFEKGILYLSGPYQPNSFYKPEFAYVIVNHPASFGFSDGFIITKVTLQSGEFRIAYGLGLQTSTTDIVNMDRAPIPVPILTPKEIKAMQPCNLSVETLGSDGVYVVGKLALFEVDPTTGEERAVRPCDLAPKSKIILKTFQDENQ
ncbi:M56 family metallopeptidase [Candidatus Acetothermia bacterium]|nr:M56 family metallopeptidase [Candidatus Acetothermia bacterium]MBI3644093.1 M56 family metallopeptidase [Candidatus Acetothermia bacterium]